MESSGRYVSGTEAGSPLGVYLCGHGERLEFTALIDSIFRLSREQEIAFRVRTVPDIKALSACLENDLFPVDLLILLQEYPGEYPVSFFDQVRRQFPLVVFVLIAGPLCEGEGRTGEIPSGCIRLYWHEWESTGLPALRKFLLKQGGRFALPVLTSAADVYSLFYEEHAAPAVSDFLYVIAETDASMSRMLTSLLQSEAKLIRTGSFVDLLEEETVPDRIVIDSFDLSQADFQRKIAQLTEQFPTSSIEILAFSPRPEEIERYRQLGCRCEIK